MHFDFIPAESIEVEQTDFAVEQYFLLMPQEDKSKVLCFLSSTSMICC